MKYKRNTDYPEELETNMAELWLKNGAIKIDNYGTENTYYKDEYNRAYYCKNYPIQSKILTFNI